jgi:arylformamidase
MTKLVYRDYDQTGLDAQYNLRALVPEHPQYFQRWAEASTEARDVLEYHLDLDYGDHPKEKLDYFPAPNSGAPILAFIHGGYWQALDKGDFSYLAPPWIERGVSFASINYPLAPEATIPEIVESCRSAVMWLYHNANELGGERRLIVVAGHSAGGHLATLLLATDWQKWNFAADLVKTACSISGVYDLEPIRLSYQNPILKLDAASARAASPVHLPAPRGKPLLLAVGTAETAEFLRQQQDLAQAWAVSEAVESYLLEGFNHYQTPDCLADPETAVFARLESLITGPANRTAS